MISPWFRTEVVVATRCCGLSCEPAVASGSAAATAAPARAQIHDDGNEPMTLNGLDAFAGYARDGAVQLLLVHEKPFQ
jgi:hypothetical protein